MEISEIFLARDTSFYEMAQCDRVYYFGMGHIWCVLPTDSRKLLELGIISCQHIYFDMHMDMRIGQIYVYSGYKGIGLHICHIGMKWSRSLSLHIKRSSDIE